MVTWVDAYIPYPDYLGDLLVAKLVQECLQIPGNLLNLIVDDNVVGDGLVYTSVRMAAYH